LNLNGRRSDSEKETDGYGRLAGRGPGHDKGSFAYKRRAGEENEGFESDSFREDKSPAQIDSKFEKGGVERKACSEGQCAGPDD